MKQLPLGILLQLGIEGNLVSGDGLQVVLLREDAVGLRLDDEGTSLHLRHTGSVSALVGIGCSDIALVGPYGGIVDLLSGVVGVVARSKIGSGTVVGHIERAGGTSQFLLGDAPAAEVADAVAFTEELEGALTTDFLLHVEAVLRYECVGEGSHMCALADDVDGAVEFIIGDVSRKLDGSLGIDEKHLGQTDVEVVGTLLVDGTLGLSTVLTTAIAYGTIGEEVGHGDRVAVIVARSDGVVGRSTTLVVAAPIALAGDGEE